MTNRIREARRAAGLTQGELAGLAGCSPAFVQMVEGGYLPKTGTKLGRIVRVLALHGHSPRDLTSRP